jgi:hypothetical protein
MREQGFHITRNTMDRLLREKLKLSRRQAAKVVSLGMAKDREQQFEQIAYWRRDFSGWLQPIISIDTKKKELLGNFYREGECYTDGQAKVLDHDFPNYGDGKAIPYGVYDVQANEGLVMLGQGSDTAELAVDAIERWWQRLGKDRYRHAYRLLILGDCGGSNGYRLPRFREQLSLLAKRIHLDIRVAHLPAYCSKYNPIEHRMFCHVHRALKGVIFRSMKTVGDAIAKTTTSTGLRVLVDYATKVYEAGVKASQSFLQNDPTRRAPILPHYNYALPC